MCLANDSCVAKVYVYSLPAYVQATVNVHILQQSFEHGTDYLKQMMEGRNHASDGHMD